MNRFGCFVAAVALALVGGCASDVEREFGQEMVRLEPIEPPTFLNAEVASLFGSASFSARVEVQKGLAGSRPPVLGELSGRDGSLFFMADQQRGRGGLTGGLSALWDGATQTAYLLNEPLQGYAPIRNSGSNGPVEVALLGEEHFNGERCRTSVVSRREGTNLVPILVVWRAVAQQDLPIRIQTTNTPTAATLTLSHFRLHAPPAELFTLPSGFKKYVSTDAMLSELVHRKTDAVSARSNAARARYGDPKEDDGAVVPGQQVRPY
jgi:hypothetical protein